MKKIMLLTLALILALSLAACGDKDNPGDGGDLKNAVADAAEHNSFSLAAAEAFWKNAGIDVNAAAPDWDWVVNEEKMATYGDKLDASYGHAQILFEKKDGGEISEEEYNAWAKKVFDATAAASDNGHNIIGWEFVGEGEDALSEVSFEKAIGGWLKGWGFLKGERNMVVYLGDAYDTNKDSEIGRTLYYYGASADVAYGMAKSMDELWQDMEDAFEDLGD